MKAVLEFNYPDDEDKLRHAIHGTEAIHALDDIRRLIRAWEKHDASNPEELIDQIKEKVYDALRQCGEE